MIRALVVCPGRGSYGRAQLGSLPAHDPIVASLDRFRSAQGRPGVSDLDHAPSFTPRLHVAGEHASILTFACTAVDVAAIDLTRVDIVGVTGNSMGFYTALHVAGALELHAAAYLVETLGHYQAENVIGAQLVYPTTDERWRPDPARIAAVLAAVAQPGVFLSIRLGGAVVLGVDAAGADHARRVLPPIERSGLTYPLELPLHSAFHTPLMVSARDRARIDLAGLKVRPPALTLFGGDGTVYRPWADAAALWAYTIGAQIVEPYDLELAISTALGELGPDTVILPGPGDSLGGAIAQIMIARRWRGLRDRQDFVAAQETDRPVVIAMSRPEQRARVVAA